jgi:hypothetical protein
VSLLDRGPGYEPVNVYMEVCVEDADGNKVTRASTTPIPAMARWQIQNQSGTSSRRAESDDEGFSTEKVYSVRFPRAWHDEHGPLGAQAVIGWGVDSQGREARYGVFGDELRYSSSRATRHSTYTVRRF